MFAQAVAPRPTNGQNDRKHFRLPVNAHVDITVPSAPVPLPATLVDLSEGGCRIACKSMLLRGGAVRFDLKIDGKAPVALTGKVMTIDYKQGNKMFHYGVQFDKLRPAVNDAVYQFIVAQQRRGIQAQQHAADVARPSAPALRSVPERSAYRVAKRFPLRYSIAGLRGTNAAFALDAGVGGMRIAFETKQQADRELDLRITLPSDVLEVLTRRESSREGSMFGRTVQITEKKARPFAEMQIQAKILPGVQEVSGRFVHSVVFVRASTLVQEELQRYVHAAQLTDLKKQRNTASGTRLL